MVRLTNLSRLPSSFFHADTDGGFWMLGVGLLIWIVLNSGALLFGVYFPPIWRNDRRIRRLLQAGRHSDHRGGNAVLDRCQYGKDLDRGRRIYGPRAVCSDQRARNCAFRGDIVFTSYQAIKK